VGDKTKVLGVPGNRVALSQREDDTAKEGEWSPITTFKENEEEEGSKVHTGQVPNWKRISKRHQN